MSEWGLFEDAEDVVTGGCTRADNALLRIREELGGILDPLEAPRLLGDKARPLDGLQEREEMGRSPNAARDIAASGDKRRPAPQGLMF